MNVRKELGRLVPLGLLTLIAAGCALVGPRDTGSTAQTAARIEELRQLPDPATLVLVLNPSAHAKPLEFRHAISLVRAVARPRLTLVGIYEQITIDDGPPFDRPIVSSAVPNLETPPPFIYGPECSGTKFQKSKCHGKNVAALERSLRDTEAWHTHATTVVSGWRYQVIANLQAAAADGATEETDAAGWNLRAALLRAGQALQAASAPHRCIALLGGLAVRRPPVNLPIDVLRHTTIVVFGWQGTQRVQKDWRARLGPTVRITFVPQTVTDIDLVSAVRGCIPSST